MLVAASLAAFSTASSSSAVAGATVGISGYSSLAPSSHSKMGQQSGKAAVLFVFSESLHFGLVLGRGPQSSTSSRRISAFPSAATHVERPQNGAKSQVSPTWIVAQRVEAKQAPGKSGKKIFLTQFCNPIGCRFRSIYDTAVHCLHKSVQKSLANR